MDDFLLCRLLPYGDRLWKRRLEVPEFVDRNPCQDCQLPYCTYINITNDLLRDYDLLYRPPDVCLSCCLSADHLIRFSRMFLGRPGPDVLVELVDGPLPRSRSHISTTANVFRDVFSSTSCCNSFVHIVPDIPLDIRSKLQ